MSTTDDDSLADVGIGPPTSGVPMPRTGGFIGRLRRNLERLEVGMMCELLNVDITQERYIRSRIPQLGREMECKFSVRVATKKRDRKAKRTLSVWRVE